LRCFACAAANPGFQAQNSGEPLAKTPARISCGSWSE
jgi:hypothetical protein